MDIFAHGLWSAAAARFGKEKEPKLSVGWSAFYGVFPDLFAFTVPFASRFFNLLSGHPHVPFIRDDTAPQFALALNLYQYSHSLVVWALVFSIVWIICRRPRYELLAWLLHILIDIPTHTEQFFPTPLFFPISSYHFPYGISWGVPWFMITNYALLGITWITLFMRKRKSAQNH